MKYEHRYLQIRTKPSFGTWSRLPEERLAELTRMLDDGWELVKTVRINGSLGFTAHVAFILRRESQ